MPENAVSIIMPTYNNALYIEQAVQSVLEQDFNDWELIIINDASTDGTAKIIEKLAQFDSRIKIFSNPTNLKLLKTLNKGLSLASFPYIARLDSDDFWSDPNKLSKQASFLEDNPEHALVGTCGLAINEKGDYLFDLTFPSEDNQIRKQLMRRNCFIHSSVMYRKVAMEKVHGYVSTEGYVEDYETWLNMGLFSEFYIFPEKMVSYRINSQGISQKNTVKQFQAFLRVASKFKKEYPNYAFSWFKLSIQILFLQIFGTKLLNSVKTKLM